MIQSFLRRGARVWGVLAVSFAFAGCISVGDDDDDDDDDDECQNDRDCDDDEICEDEECVRADSGGASGGSSGRGGSSSTGGSGGSSTPGGGGSSGNSGSLDCQATCDEIAACVDEEDATCRGACQEDVDLMNSIGCGTQYAALVNCVVDTCGTEQVPAEVCASAAAVQSACVCAQVPDDPSCTTAQ